MVPMFCAAPMVAATSPCVGAELTWSDSSVYGCRQGEQKRVFAGIEFLGGLEEEERRSTTAFVC